MTTAKDGTPRRDDNEPVFDTGSPDERQRDSSVPDEGRPAPEPPGDAPPPVVTGDPNDEEERDGKR